MPASGITIGTDALQPIARLLAGDWSSVDLGNSAPDNYVMRPDANLHPSGVAFGDNSAPVQDVQPKTKLQHLQDIVGNTDGTAPQAPQAQAAAPQDYGQNFEGMPLPDYQQPGQPGPIASRQTSDIPDIAGMPAAQQQAKRPPTWFERHPELTKLLQGGLQLTEGGLVGSQYSNAGQGFQAAQQQIEHEQMLPLQRLFQQAALENSLTTNALNREKLAEIPLDRQVKIAGIGKTQAETKVAEKNAQPNDALDALRKAQAASARYKTVGGALYDVSGDMPVPVKGQGMFVPLDDATANVANLPVGTQVPLETAYKLKQLSDAGVKTVQAGGRSLLVDSRGKKIADLGASNPIVINSLNNPLRDINTGDLTGDAVLKVLPPRMQKLIQGIANYDISPSSISTRNNQRADVMGIVKQYDPTYDETQYNTKASLRKDFTSGKSAQNIRSLNTAIGHLEQLQEAANVLDNTRAPIWNQVANTFSYHVGSDKMTNFNAVKNAVSGEVSAVFKGGVPDVADRQEIDKTLNSANSPQELQGAIMHTIKLMGSRLNALNSQYERGIGKPADFRILSPESESILNKMGAGNLVAPPRAATPSQVNQRDKKLNVVYLTP